MNLSRSSWFGLVGYCAVAALATALFLAVLFAGATATFAVGQSEVAESPAPSRFSGMVTDDHCGAKHDRYTGKSASECARLCALNGAKYVLLDGDKIYTLAGKDVALDKFAGERATVVGTLEANVIHVASVTAEHP